MRSIRVSTGLPGMDRMIDDLRWGDNVVWQVDNIDDYSRYVQFFARQCIRDQKNLVYLRFGLHPPLLNEGIGLKIYELDSNQGFEAFSTAVHYIAVREGEGTCFVFDCLSDLLSSWNNDLMIGNFFRVTCPFLFELVTIAYFSILRDRNSLDTIDRIRDITQLFISVFRLGNETYVFPNKVWQRHSSTMFLPHLETNSGFLPISSSMQLSRLLSDTSAFSVHGSRAKLDYWDKIILKAEELINLPDDEYIKHQKIEMIEILLKMMIGRNQNILQLARSYFDLKDLLAVHSRLIGTGYIGGKAVGMLLARKILALDHQRDWLSLLEPHDSFYLGSDVYYTYLVENGCWNLRLQQKQRENYFASAPELRQSILEGEFPDFIRHQLFRIQDYFGQSPIIVRSSSLLEDAFGNAFAGKYESIFLTNQGNPQERYLAFEKAIQTVYASTMNDDALNYRKLRGLDLLDEQMAVLVQRVSGSYHDKYFFPDLAGVALSRNPYLWDRDLDGRSGMVRLVSGLGTRAVNRVEDDYPLILALDKPQTRIDSSLKALRKFSQHRLDVLDTALNNENTIKVNDIAALMHLSGSWNLIAERDHETTRIMNDIGMPGEAWLLTFNRLIQNTDFASYLHDILNLLEESYQSPVDIEFTVNFNPELQMQINLLQCRPLQLVNPMNIITGDSFRRIKAQLFTVRSHFMGWPREPLVRYIIYISALEYRQLTENKKHQVARLIGKLNRLFNDCTYLLIGPGRWGTSTPDLGVSVSFSEIYNTIALVEYEDDLTGCRPELSFGTHFFHDLVENHILYAALLKNNKGCSFTPGLLASRPNHFSNFLPDYMEYEEVIKVLDLSADGSSLWLEIDLENRLTAHLVYETG
ncbi:MAG TPA: PEP/pyruvate-binding domain-containing protein [Syntrophomonadaceae bacterium]|nr:PEP/pyruvate-binding domain-containing protein [Syntrophomonadaceae bacterium]